MAHRDADVLIAGSGLAGLATAAALRDTAPGLDVIVIDPAGAPDEPAGDGPGMRVSAVTPAAVELFERVGAWQRMPETHARAYARMRVWDAATDCGDGVRFDAVDYGRTALGHIVDNAMLRWVLFETLRDDPGVSFEAAAIDALDASPDGVAVTADGGDRFAARLLVGADGRNSTVRRLSGISVSRWSHDQSAVVAHLASERDHETCALQRFLPDGPLALLPLPDGRVSLVWSTRPGHAERLEAYTDEAFARAVTRASDGVLGALTPTTPRVSFPLASHYAADPVGCRTVLVGDSAHAVHPLAGQGANLGFEDAACLARIAAAAAADGADVGDPPWLRRYRRARKVDTAGMVYGLDLLNRLFARETGALADLRRAGMRWFDASPAAKRLAAARAMGATGAGS